MKSKKFFAKISFSKKGYFIKRGSGWKKIRQKNTQASFWGMKIFNLCFLRIGNFFNNKILG